MPVSIPPFSNVPAPTDPLTSKWAQDITQFAVDQISSGPTAPTNPDAELWYDTADPGVSFPNMPRGYVGNRDQTAADFALASTGWQDVPGMTAISFTPAGPNRWFKFTFFGTIKLTGAGNPVVIVGIHDGSTQVWAQEIYAANQSAATPSVPFAISAVRQLSNPGTYKPQVYANGSGASLMGLGGRAARFVIEDIGGS